MRVEIDRWLCQLPAADEQFAEGIVLEGWLLAGEDGEARILTGRLCLAFARGDVTGIEEILHKRSEAPGAGAIHVRLNLRRGARLLAASPAELFDGSIPTRAPFPLATRPAVVRTAAMPRFRALERNYLDRTPCNH